MLKLAALHAITEGASTSQQLADLLNINLPNAQMVLWRLHRQGLVGRFGFIPYRSPYVYTITMRGQQRLEYLERTLK